MSHARCSIAPPDLLLRLAERGTPEQKAAAARALALSASVRARRSTLTQLVQEGFALSPAAPAAGGKKITVYDAGHAEEQGLPGKKIRKNGAPAVADAAVNEAYDGASTTYDFYHAIFGRDSVDDQGLELVSSVHFSNDYDNAFWDGEQMVYGDGSGEIFVVGGMTKDLTVMAHELTHGVTQYTAGLVYHKQSGALNESMSDVFGSLVKQYSLGQTADQADWLIGEGILGTELQGVALRSMKAPGTAYEGDNQPADMDHYVDLPDDGNPRHDHGGVHINSGIPNHAFYLLATNLGGNAWETAGSIWYETLTTKLLRTAQFADAANATVKVATARYGAGSTELQAVEDAWKRVGVLEP